MNREQLAERQHEVLAALLRHEVPAGFDPRSARLTSRALTVKRRSEVLLAAPELRDLPDVAARFDAWAAAHPREGCGHDDALSFLVGTTGPLPEPLASIRAIERVYRREAIWAVDRRPGRPRWVVACGSRVLHLGRRSPATA